MKPEEQFHKAVAQYLAVALRPPTIWTTFPAGGGGKVRGAKLKAMGLKAGWPDILVLHRASKTTTKVLGIELKAGRGSQSEGQIAFQVGLMDAGGQYVVCRTLADIYNALTWARIPAFAEPYGAGWRKVAP